MSVKACLTVVCATGQNWNCLDQQQNQAIIKNVSQAYSATLHETKAAHIIFQTSFEQKQKTTTNHDQSNKEEVNSFSWKCHQEGEINILQEIERGDPQEGTYGRRAKVQACRRGSQWTCPRLHKPLTASNI